MSKFQSKNGHNSSSFVKDTSQSHNKFEISLLSFLKCRSMFLHCITNEIPLTNLNLDRSNDFWLDLK